MWGRNQIGRPQMWPPGYSSLLPAVLELAQGAPRHLITAPEDPRRRPKWRALVENHWLIVVKPGHRHKIQNKPKQPHVTLPLERPVWTIAQKSPSHTGPGDTFLGYVAFRPAQLAVASRPASSSSAFWGPTADEQRTCWVSDRAFARPRPALPPLVPAPQRAREPS